MWLNLTPQLLAFIFSFFLADVAKTHATTNVYAHLQEAVREVKNNINLRYLSLSEVFGGAGLAAYEYQAAVFSAVWPTWAIGIARAIQEAGVVPSFYFAGKTIDILGIRKVIWVGMITASLGNIAAALARSIFSPIFIMISLPLYGASDTAHQHVLQKEFTEHQRATIASLNSLGSSIYFSLVLYFCGLIANNWGPFTALFATQIFWLPSAYYQIKFLNKIK